MPSSSAPSELEAKLLVERESDMDAFARLERLGPYRLRPQPVQQLYSQYLDSKDLALAQRRVVLRVRRHGDNWEATIKWPGSIRGAVHDRPELTVVLEGPPTTPFVAPADLQVHLAAMLAGRKLVPILVSEIERRPIDVLDAAAQQRVAEIALDRVYLHSPHHRDRRAERYCEIEIERKQGTSSDVDALTALMRRGRRLHPSHEGKFARGMRLLFGNVVLENVVPNELRFDDSLHAAATKIIRAQGDHLIERDPDTRRGEDTEALHDMRVACRRLRALVRLLPSAFTVEHQRRLERDLRWLGQTLGVVRDIDVQIHHLEKLGANTRGQRRVAYTTYEDHLHRSRAESRALMQEALNSTRYFRLLLQIERLGSLTTDIAATEHDETVGAAAVRAIRHADKKLRKCAERIDKHPHAEDLHEVRIRAKRLRYACEFVRVLTGRPGRNFIKRLVKLQDLLGAHNDAVVAITFARRYLDESSPAPKDDTRQALAHFIETNEDLASEARAAFRHAWNAFTKRRNREQLEAMIALLS